MKKVTEDIFTRTAQELENAGFSIVSRDEKRPWGGFFVIDEQQAERFAETYFPEFSATHSGGKLSPKFLMVKPHTRLSWQYHHRRAELWRILHGEVAIVRSMDDTQGLIEHCVEGTRVHFQQGERHRLIGLEDWGVVAEIWQHTDPSNPSDEDDIVRLQDDYGR